MFMRLNIWSGHIGRFMLVVYVILSVVSRGEKLL